jgi:hypothetical protein
MILLKADLLNIMINKIYLNNMNRNKGNRNFQMDESLEMTTF